MTDLATIADDLERVHQAGGLGYRAHAILEASIDALRRALEPQEGRETQVKTLEWRKAAMVAADSYGWLTIRIADTPFGQYRVDKADRHRFRVTLTGQALANCHPTNDAAAEDAAQADYEQRILSCLASPPTAGEVVAWWDVEEFKVWKGIDQDKPVWGSRGFCCSSWSDAARLMDFLAHNDPALVLRVSPCTIGSAVPPVDDAAGEVTAKERAIIHELAADIRDREHGDTSVRRNAQRILELSRPRAATQGENTNG